MPAAASGAASAVTRSPAIGIIRPSESCRAPGAWIGTYPHTARKRLARFSTVDTPPYPVPKNLPMRAGGMRGNGAQECRTSLISPKNSTLERAHASPGSASVSPACAAGAAWECGRLARMRAGGACTQSIRTPRLPLLPSWEKGAGGMRGNGARECRTSLISPKNSTLASRGVRGKSAPECRKSRISFKKSTLESAHPGLRAGATPAPPGYILFDCDLISGINLCRGRTHLHPPSPPPSA